MGLGKEMEASLGYKTKTLSCKKNKRKKKRKEGSKGRIGEERRGEQGATVIKDPVLELAQVLQPPNSPARNGAFAGSSSNVSLCGIKGLPSIRHVLPH